MVVGVALMLVAWLMIIHGSQKRRVLALMGTATLAAAIFTIIQARY